MIKQTLEKILIFIFCALLGLFVTALFWFRSAGQGPTIIYYLGFLICLINFYASFYPKEKKSNNSDQRILALRVARNFLIMPDKHNIMDNLKLSNHYCTMYLHKGGRTLTITEKIPPYRNSSTEPAKQEVVFNYWNNACYVFNKDTTYDYIIRNILFNNDNVFLKPLYSDNFLRIKKTTQNNKIEIEMVDINNCSISEITALAGINIALAKRIVKKREDIDGFKNIDEFIEFINLKPHFERQIRPRILIKQKPLINKIIHFKERSIDI